MELVTTREGVCHEWEEVWRGVWRGEGGHRLIAFPAHMRVNYFGSTGKGKISKIRHIKSIIREVYLLFGSGVKCQFGNNESNI